MSYEPETNPHFFWEERPLQPVQPESPYALHGQTSPEHLHPGRRPRFYGGTPPEQPHHGRRPRLHGLYVDTPQGQPDRGRSGPHGPHQGRPSQPHDQATQDHQSSRPQGGSFGPLPVKQPHLQHPHHQQARPFGERSQHHGRGSHHQPGGGLRVPPPRSTKPLTWFGAVFCAIFWVVVILGGLIVLIVYLLFRPRSPRFEISTASLNAAYPDMGYLLNADLTLLANFTNPNKKVSVDFSFIVINLYYENTLIATRSIYPFSAARMQTVFENVHMVTSQVPLSFQQTQVLANQMERDRVVFALKGFFRVRSNLGGLLRYTYWLYAKCYIVFTRPPSGVLLATKCKTKR